MSELNISFDDFKGVLVDIFGQPLTEKAEVAAQDFWQNASAISKGVSVGSIVINVDVLALARAFPEYKTYQAWKGLAVLALSHKKHKKAPVSEAINNLRMPE